MTNLLRLILTIGVLAALGCGSSGGGESAESVCSNCDVQTPAAIAACQEFYNACRLDDAGGGEDCAVGARQRCGA